MSDDLCACGKPAKLTGQTQWTLGKGKRMRRFCSFACHQRAIDRRFKTSHGGPVDSAGESDDRSYGMGDFRNQFDALFDKREGD